MPCKGECLCLCSVENLIYKLSSRLRVFLFSFLICHQFDALNTAMDPQMRFVHVQPANMASGRIVPVFREVSRLPQPKKRTRKTRYAPASNFNIRGLPRELRAIIFREDLLEWTNDKLTPPLVQALRPEFQLYQEVLDLFYFLKPCSITGRNQRSVLSIPRSVLKRVLFVDLHYG